MPFWANIIIIIVIAFFVSLTFTVMLLYMLIFPLVNKLFKTDLPSYNYNFGEAEDDTDEPSQKDHDKANLTARGRVVALDKDKEKAKDRFEQNRSVQPISRPKFVDFHKDVPTVKLPEVVAKEPTKELNASKINAAVVNTKMERVIKKDDNDNNVKNAQGKMTEPKKNTKAKSEKK